MSDIKKSDSSSEGSHHGNDVKLDTSDRDAPTGLHLTETIDVNHNPSGQVKNPLAGIPRAQLMSDVEQFCSDKGLQDEVELIKRGALVAQSPLAFEEMEELSEEEKKVLTREQTHKWSHPILSEYYRLIARNPKLTALPHEKCT